MDWCSGQRRGEIELLVRVHVIGIVTDGQQDQPPSCFKSISISLRVCPEHSHARLYSVLYDCLMVNVCILWTHLEESVRDFSWNLQMQIIIVLNPLIATNQSSERLKDNMQCSRGGLASNFSPAIYWARYRGINKPGCLMLMMSFPVSLERSLRWIIPSDTVDSASQDHAAEFTDHESGLSWSQVCCTTRM